MSTLRRLVAVALACAVLAPAAAAADDDRYGLPVPPGSQVSERGDSTFVSSRGFRDTLRYYQRHFRRHAIAHRAPPVYRARGVAVARLLATSGDARWGAVHVYRHRGTTYIAVIPPLDPEHGSR